jgi:hypothetical protein
MHSTSAEEAQEVGEEDELEAMFKPKKKRRQERDQADKKSIVEELLARMEVGTAASWGCCRTPQGTCSLASLLAEPMSVQGAAVEPHSYAHLASCWHFQVAAELDKAAYEEGRPAIHKLQMLADVDRVNFRHLVTSQFFVTLQLGRNGRLCACCVFSAAAANSPSGGRLIAPGPFEGLLACLL